MSFAACLAATKMNVYFSYVWFFELLSLSVKSLVCFSVVERMIGMVRVGSFVLKRIRFRYADIPFLIYNCIKHFLKTHELQYIPNIIICYVLSLCIGARRFYPYSSGLLNWRSGDCPDVSEAGCKNMGKWCTRLDHELWRRWSHNGTKHNKKNIHIYGC